LETREREETKGSISVSDVAGTCGEGRGRRRKRGATTLREGKDERGDGRQRVAEPSRRLPVEREAPRK
jgi:hypothetical protein